MTEREQLRERLVALMPWGDAGSFDAVDAILSEIEAAGYVLMEREKAESLQAFWEHEVNRAAVREFGEGGE